jgi:hypothetical protein
MVPSEAELAVASALPVLAENSSVQVTQILEAN